MNKLKLAIMTLLVLGVSSLAMLGVAHAQSFSMTVPKDKTIDSSLYSAGRHIVIEGTVNGDVYCAGQDVEVRGTVKGDVICAGRSIRIEGTVDGNIRVAGQEIHIAAKIGRSATVAGQQVYIEKQTAIGQDLTLAGSRTVLRGTVGRDMVANGTNVYVEGHVKRNVRMSGEQLALRSSAKIDGSLHYTSARTVEKDTGAVVTGRTTQASPPQRGSSFFNNKNLLIAGVAMFIFAMALVLIAPQYIHKTSMVATESIGRASLLGAASIVALPIIAALFASSVVGLPITILLIVLMVFTILLSGPILAYYLGSMLMAKNKNAIQIMALGAAVLLVLYAMPIIGPLFMLIAYMMGGGTLLLALKRAIGKPNYTVE